MKRLFALFFFMASCASAQYVQVTPSTLYYNFVTHSWYVNAVPTGYATATYTFTPSLTPTPTRTQTLTFTSTFTFTPTNTIPAGTHTATPLNTRTPTPTYTFTPTFTNTAVYTSTSTYTPTPNQTDTSAPSVANAVTATGSNYAGAYQLVSVVSEVTGGSGNGIILPNWLPYGTQITIMNLSGGGIKAYPPGNTGNILFGGLNTSPYVTLEASSTSNFIQFNTGQWSGITDN